VYPVNIEMGEKLFKLMTLERHSTAL
jgi:hypothetical protein